MYVLLTLIGENSKICNSMSVCLTLNQVSENNSSKTLIYLSKSFSFRLSLFFAFFFFSFHSSFLCSSLVGALLCFFLGSKSGSPVYLPLVCLSMGAKRNEPRGIHSSR